MTKLKQTILPLTHHATRQINSLSLCLLQYFHFIQSKSRFASVHATKPKHTNTPPLSINDNSFLLSIIYIFPPISYPFPFSPPLRATESSSMALRWPWPRKYPPPFPKKQKKKGGGVGSLPPPYDFGIRIPSPVFSKQSYPVSPQGFS